MWSHYADNHRGVCLEFATANPLFATAKAVQYLKDYPSWVPMDADQVVKTVYTKSNEWEYEDEYRLLGIRTARIPRPA